jgi:hypothetical protein
VRALRRIEFAFAALVYSWLIGCDCAPMPVVDAGAPFDATQSDAPYVCTPRDECPSWCNWTPCGCASDNPALSCE